MSHVPIGESTDLPWEGPSCPTCGHELDVEVLPTSEEIAIVYMCQEHGAVALDRPFDTEDREVS